jgi:DNA mismatch endonuclease, patch repair protein
MSKIRGKDTKPEIIVRKLLWYSGYRYRLHAAGLPGKPDIVFRRKKKVIFVNGCFWHKHSCKYFKWPKSNSEFWHKKIMDTTERDQKNYQTLGSMGWESHIVWECELSDLEKTLEKLVKFLN